MNNNRNGGNQEDIIDIPNDKGTASKYGHYEHPTSLKKFVKKVVCSEGFLFLLGLTAIVLDPLFFYVPMMKNNSTCLGLDKTLLIVAVIFRTLVDVLHDWSWWNKSFHDRQRYIRNTRALQKWHTCMERFQNLFEWLGSYKIPTPAARSSVPSRVIAIMASLPFPQVVAFALDLKSGLMSWLMLGVICQFVPRIFRIHPTYVAVTTRSDIYAWIGAAFNLLLFVVASHALGGFWYLNAVSRKVDCMKEACQGHPGCTATSLYCGIGNHAFNGFFNGTCDAQPTSNATIPFDYGIYTDAVKSNLIGSTNIINKLAHGFWWGISNLSSMAQNLEFTDHIWDTCFEIFICILGLLLFALLIGNLQVYVQSTLPSKLQKLKEKRVELQGWAPFRHIPRDLRKEVINTCQHRKWREVTEVNLKSFLNNIPSELRKKLKPHFCHKLFNKDGVKEFEVLNERIKKELQERARAVVFEERTIIQEKGSPISEMIYILQGKAFAYKTHDAKVDWPVERLQKDDSFGEELLRTALESPEPKLPLAKQTIRAETKVEAFALSFDDFAITFNKYGWFIETYKKQWAANLIIGAWRKNRLRRAFEEVTATEGNSRSKKGVADRCYRW